MGLASKDRCLSTRCGRRLSKDACRSSLGRGRSLLAEQRSCLSLLGLECQRGIRLAKWLLRLHTGLSWGRGLCTKQTSALWLGRCTEERARSCLRVHFCGLFNKLIIIFDGLTLALKLWKFTSCSWLCESEGGFSLTTPSD